MIGRILVPLDGSALAELALPRAAALAAPFGSELTLLRVVERVGGGREPADSFTWRLLRAEATAYLNKVKGRLAEEGIRAECLVAEGIPAERILACVRERDADLIVLGSHAGSGFKEFAFGHTAQQVVSTSAASTMIVRFAKGKEGRSIGGATYRKVMVALDGSPRAESALWLAASIACCHKAELLMAQVVSGPEMVRRLPLTPEEERLSRRIIEMNRDAAERYLTQLQAHVPAADTMVRARVLASGQVARTLRDLSEQEDADLLVLSAHGHSGDRQWLRGAVADSLIAHSRISTLVVQDMAYTESGQLHRLRGQGADLYASKAG